MNFLKYLWRVWQLRRSRVWTLAENAVQMVSQDKALQVAAQSAPMLTFCPRCGQRPDGDRRMEEARELVMARLGSQPIVRRDLDFALAFHYWFKRL